MQYQGVLKRMMTELNNPIKYYMDFEDDFIVVNNLLNKELEIEFIKYQCLSCGTDAPIFAQGFCKKCYFESPATGEWIMKPELSTAHLDIAHRDLSYEKEVQLSPHIVYLAKTNNIKVGVTRKSQVPFRWIDQGADEAIAILETPNRFLAGKAEVFLKQFYTDKTGWQQMLKGKSSEKKLIEEKKKIKEKLPADLKKFFLEETNVLKINYPIIKYPEKVKSLNLSKIPSFKGKLTGIKGQYLIFENGNVFNVRNHSGFVVNLKF